ncbi:hypothetical protein ABT324_30780 [Saccharopolyspora sp. NPDC000359]|uniref:hypothetical protein n=1 Tax=Saccharopolyspora sp. NPDC000359 TaxID=3154251 RepID=UPI00332D58BA
MLLGLQILLGTPAAAQGWSSSCEEAPTPDMPNGGPVITTLDQVHLGQGVPGSAYGDLGYAGAVWHTYGYSGSCAISDPFAGIDTYLGSQLFNVGKAITAATNGLHYTVSTGGALDQVDDFIATATIALYDNVFTPYAAVVLTIVAVMILGWTLRGDMASIGRKTMWVLVGAWFAAATYMTPLVYTHMTDSFLVDGTNELQSNIMRGVGNDDYLHGLPTMLHDETVYRPWLNGEFGAANGPDAERFGRRLIEAQACTKYEVETDSCNIEDKKRRFTELAAELKDTAAWPYFTGEAHSRTGAGAVALAKAVCFSLFQLLCKIGILLAQLVIRLIIVGGPILGLLAMLSNTLLPTVLRAVGGALGQGLLLAAAAALHTFVLGYVLALEMSQLLQLAVIGGLTFGMWIALRPIERLIQMLASMTGIQVPSWSQRRMTRAMRGGRGPVARLRRRLGRADARVADLADRVSDHDEEYDDYYYDDEPIGAGRHIVRPEGAPSNGRAPQPGEGDQDVEESTFDRILRRGPSWRGRFAVWRADTVDKLLGRDDGEELANDHAAADGDGSTSTDAPPVRPESRRPARPEPVFPYAVDDDAEQLADDEMWETFRPGDGSVNRHRPEGHQPQWREE